MLTIGVDMHGFDASLAIGEARIESVHIHTNRQHQDLALSSDRYAHPAASSTRAAANVAASVYMTTEGAGLWHSVYEPKQLDGALRFKPVPSYPFSHPTRVLSNPYNHSELWVTSFGNGLYSGVVAHSVVDPT